jgi:hypothetical protein
LDPHGTRCTPEHPARDGAAEQSILRVVAIGLIVGMPIVLAGIRIAASQFYELAPRDSWSMGLPLQLIRSVAAVARVVPARRAPKLIP